MPDRLTPLEIVPVDSDDADEVSARITARAFGMRFDEQRHRNRRALRRSGHFLNVHVAGEPVATGGAWPFTMSLPGGTSAPVWGITAMGVLASHRRRGILTRVLSELMAEGAARGSYASILYASESSIYGRFGFAPVTPSMAMRLPARQVAFRADVAASGGRCHVWDVHRRDALPVALAEAYEASRRRRPGELGRSDEVWSGKFGSTGETGHDDRLYLVHTDEGGSPDGYAIYSVTDDWQPTGPQHVLRVKELMAATDAVEIDLWRALIEHDLVAVIEATVPPDWIVREVLADPGVVPATRDQGLWARILDVPAALSARRYRVSGSLVVEVRDSGWPGTSGVFELVADPEGSAVCEPSSRRPDLDLDVAALSQVWLGAGSLSRLHRAGRVRELTPGASAKADALFGWDPGPFTTHFF